jgi:hypothetical protein
VENLTAKHSETEPYPSIAVALNSSELPLLGVLSGFVQDSTCLAPQGDSRPFKQIPQQKCCFAPVRIVRIQRQRKPSPVSPPTPSRFPNQRLIPAIRFSFRCNWSNSVNSKVLIFRVSPDAIRTRKILSKNKGGRKRKS